MRRVVLSILVVIAVLILGAIAALWIILATDYPRQLAEQTLCDQTGLEFRIGELSVEWDGRTSIRELSASLPLDDRPFLHIPHLEIGHADLVWLILSGTFAPDRVEAEQVTITALEYEEGQWNLGRVVEVIEHAFAAASDPAGSSISTLPEIVVGNGTVDVVRHDGARITWDNIRVEGEPAGSTAWRFSAGRAPEISISGKLMPRPPMRHEISFEFNNVEQFLHPWIDELPSPLAGAGTWAGSIDAGEVRGRLILDRASIGDDTLAGEVRLFTNGEYVTVEPASLILTTSRLSNETLRVKGGRLRVQSQTISADNLSVAHLGAEVRLTGDWDIARRQGTVRAVWEGARAGDEGEDWIDYHGEADLTISAPTIGRVNASARIELAGRSPYGRLEAQIEARAEGESWQTLAGRFSFPLLQWKDQGGVLELNGLALSADFDWPRLQASGLAIPDARQVAGHGSYNAESNEWAVSFSAESWRIPRLPPRDFDIVIEASGNPQVVDFSRFKLRTGEAQLHAAGRYEPEAATPFVARATLSIDDLPVLFEAARLRRESALIQSSSLAVGSTGSTTSTTDPGPTPRGRVSAELDITGRLNPLEISYKGNLAARWIQVGGLVIEETTFPWQGLVTDELATFRGETFRLFGGEWELDGALSPGETTLRARLTGRGIALRQLAAILDHAQNARGTVETEVALTLPQFDPDRMIIEGQWEVTDAAIGPLLRAEHGSGSILARRDSLQLHDIVLADRSGRIEGSADFDFLNGRRLALDLRATDWPMNEADAGAAVVADGTVSLDVDLAKRTAKGDLACAADLLIDQDHFGNLNIDASINARNVVVDRFHASLLNGEADGRASVTLDDWKSARADLQWSGIDLALLPAFLPAADGLAGVTSGTLSMLHPDQKRLPEPLRIDLYATIDEGTYRDEITLNNLDVLAYVGPDRQMIEEVRASVADGSVRVWGRLSRHREDLYAQAFVTLEDLDLNQLVHAGDLALPEVPGRLSGRASFGGYFGYPSRSFGSGRLYLRDSDLGSLPVFTAIYDLLRLDFGTQRPMGRGVLDFRLEGRALEVTRLEYFNRGTDVIGSATLRDFWKGGESPVDGVAVGAVRPFRDLDLPLFDDLDRLVRAMQTDTAVVRIRGTLADREIEPVPFAEVGSRIQRLLQASLGD